MSDLRQNRPRFSEEEARSLVQEFYGLDGTLAELPSERDQNFHLRVLKTEREFVLKISSAAEQQEVLEFQNKAIEHLARNVPEFIWPRIQVSKAGESIVRVAHSSGSRHYVRLLTHLPGRFLAEVRPHRPGLLRSLGCFLGRMDMALFSFQHPAMERELKWDMRKALTTLNRLLPFIEGEEERNLARHFMGLYEQRVVPLLPGLRTSVIHNDANDYNVLVGHASADPAGRFGRVAGIIDFGDMLCGYTVGELAVGVTYAAMGKNDPLEAAALIVSAYHEVLPLEASEAEVLYDLIAIRLLLSVAISAEQKKQEEANAYLTISEKPAWTLLREWRRISPSWARRVFRNACGLSVCPESVHIKGWLKDHQKDLGPVLQSSFEETPPLVLDLSVTSPGLNERAGGWDTRELSAWISSQLRAASRRVGLGRYNEIRGFYTSDMFKLRRNDGFEQRTLHLGVDLFLDPGSAVLAPLDGTVHSFRDNDNPLDYGPTIILEHRTGEGQLFYTLYGHLSRDSLKGLAKGMLIKKGDRLGRIGSYAENGGWPPHLHFQVMADMLDRKGDFPGVAPPSQKEIWIALCPDPNLVLKIPEDTQPGLSPERTRKEILLLRRKHLGPTLSIAYKRPLKIVRGFGQFLYDENGQAYLDAVNNVA
ncbi:MAG: alanine--glyoxylate aminotransferase, partial [Candidatus Aminicenantes bacterium]|nr:alanine--glyoxylate aminotransferase [Candidatus Aminicenantes bacterium]